MQLVYVNSDYISYLRGFDRRVRMNKSHHTDDDPISFLLLNDMIPVAKDCYTPINFDSEKQNNFKKYTLLLAEVNYIRPKKESIMKRAKKVYVNRTDKNIPFINQMCLDFKDLENRLNDYLDK